jgi:hypothetical protein
VRLREPLCFLVVWVLLVTPVVAQSPNGTLNGLVLDPSGGAIAGADITIVNDATRVQYSGKTNSEGIYVVTNLPPGPYRLQVAKVGFKTLIKPDIILNVLDSLAINFTLPIGATSETVTVQGGAPLVNTESGSVSTVIDRNFVESLPLNGRSFNTLLQLTPGVVIASTGNSPESPGQFSIGGQRTDANNFTVDGVSANFGVSATTADPGASGTGSAQAFSALGGTSSLVSVDALEEFRIETSSFAPEFGRSPGGQVILTTRSGTNNVHGALYDYFRNTVMDANDWFNDQAGIPRSPEHHNDFGGVLGGPVWKDKTFFFLSYEGARLDEPGTDIIQVPYIATAVPSCSAPATIGPFLGAYPKPNGPVSTTDCTGQFTGSFSNKARLDAGSARVDHTFNSRFSVFGRYNDAPSEFLQPNNSLSTVTSTEVDTKTLTLGLNVFLTSQMSNTFRANYSTQKGVSADYLDSFGGAVPPPLDLLLGNLSSQNSFASFGIIGVSTYETGPTNRNATAQTNFVDDFSLSVGTHQMKYGMDYRRIDLHIQPPQSSAFYLSFSGVPGFLSSGGQVFMAGVTEAPARLRSQSLSLYAQDTWRASSRVTIAYGIRWELAPAPAALGTTTLASWTDVNDPSEIALAPRKTPVWRTTYGNFAPRVGLTYALTDKGDFILRAGGGIFYDLGVGSVAALGVTFPHSAIAEFPSVQVPIVDLSPFLGVISTSPPYGAVQAFAPNLKLPRSYQWNVALEKSFGGKQVISATYVGQAGRELLRQEALYQPNSNFESTFQVTQNDARSNYNALQLQLRRPLSSGLQALLGYTWSHSLDNASNDVLAGYSNTVISAASDYASSNFDVRHSFSGALVYDVPAASMSGPLGLLTRDWSINSVIVARSGFPFNAQLENPSPGLAGLVSTRPDLVSGEPLWVSAPGAPGGKMLNISAFSIPSTIRQGTEGRNDIPGFGLTQIDLSIGRRFSLTERFKLQFRADAFNVLNHPNFLNPSGFFTFGSSGLQSTEMLNQGLGGLNPLFQEGGPRSLQLSLKLTF